MIFEKEFLQELENFVIKKDIKSIESFIKEPIRREKIKKLYIRSALMVSGINPKHLNKIDSLDADIVMINLEDGVSKELKPIALKLSSIFLSNLKKSNSLIVVRVNPLDEGGEDEIKYLNRFDIDAIRVPKIKDIDDVKRALSLTNKDIHLSIETKEAFLNLEKLRVDKRVKIFYLGILDLLSDMDIFQNILTIENPTIDFILSRFLIISKSIRVLPISFVYQDYQNLEEFEEWCRYEKGMGFNAKSCISLKQVEIVNRVFNIDKNIIKRAKYIKDRFEDMLRKGVSGFSDEKYGFIDEPIYKDAINILKSANIKS